MAITRAQQAKQMLAQGGRIRFQGGGADMGSIAGASQGPAGGATIGSGSPQSGGPASTGIGLGGNTGPDAGFFISEQVRREKELKDLIEKQQEEKFFEEEGFETLRVPKSNIPGITGTILDTFQGPRQKALDFNVDYYLDLTERREDDESFNSQRYSRTAQGYRNYMADRQAGKIDAAGNRIMGSDDDQPIIPIQTGIMTQDSLTTDQETNEEEDEGLRLAFRANGGRIGFFKGAQADTKKGKAMSPGTTASGEFRSIEDDGPQEPPKVPTDSNEKPDTPIQADPRFSFGKNIGKGLPPKELARFFNEFYGLPNPDDEENETITAGAEINVSDVRTDPLASFIRNQPEFQSKVRDTVSGIMSNPNIANLGQTGFAVGGLADGNFDFENARQMYGLGKLVKKVTRSVKKIAKSPIGKAALLYAGTAGLGALGAGAARAGTGFGIFAPSNVLSNLGATKALFTNKLFGDVVAPSMTRTGGILDFIGGKAGAAIIGTSVLAGLLTAKQEDEAQLLADTTGIDIDAARRSILERAQGNTKGDLRMLSARADGGRIGYQEGSKEPVAKKTMPLLDLDGKEMDLRAEGGFVPIGRMEKADDVPARLSKNEFVFTADAVRNAGDGNVDKGAEVMYNMMKNLEAGGDVSKESQGLQGARKMFQTSQRLEEVL